MREPDQAKLEDFLHKVIGDLGAAVTAPLVRVRDALGLYRAMADGEPVTAAELAGRTETAQRYVREWLAAQAASGYVHYDGDGRFHMEPEQAVAFTDESSPACVIGGFQNLTAATKIVNRLIEAFRTGEGIGWHEHDPDLFVGTARFFRPGYAAHLVSEWLPALDGVVEKLHAGGRVADVGCGHGLSTLLMAQAFPASAFVGYDYHVASIEAARKTVADAGVADRTKFAVAGAKDFPGTGYDLITYFDCLHDIGDPVGALVHARSALAPDGAVMLVEPYAGNSLEENLNPLGRTFYGASTLICTPASLSQEVGRAMGAQAGEDGNRQVATEAGFSGFRRATETPFNIVYELRP